MFISISINYLTMNKQLLSYHYPRRPSQIPLFLRGISCTSESTSFFWMTILNLSGIHKLSILWYTCSMFGKKRKKERKKEREKKRRERGKEKDILTNVSTRITIVFRCRSKSHTFTRGWLGLTMISIQLTQRTLPFQTYCKVKTTKGISHEEENRTVSWVEGLHKPITFSLRFTMRY